MRRNIILIFLSFLLFQFKANAQGKNDTLYTDFDLNNFEPVQTTSSSPADSNRYFVKYFYNKLGKKDGFQFLYRVRESYHARIAKKTETSFGTVLAFRTEKTPGYEKVIIFADWDYLKDSVMQKNDTIIHKEIADDYMYLHILYPPRGDTLDAWRLYCNTRYSNEHQAGGWAALKNYRSWPGDYNYDAVEHYILIKRENHYEILTIETTRSTISDYDRKRISDEIKDAGLSRFRIAIRSLSY